MTEKDNSDYECPFCGGSGEYHADDKTSIAVAALEVMAAAKHELPCGDPSTYRSDMCTGGCPHHLTCRALLHWEKLTNSTIDELEDEDVRD